MNYVNIIDSAFEAIEMIVTRNRGEHAAHFLQRFKFADIFRAYIGIFTEGAVGFLGVKLIKSPVMLYALIIFFALPYELHSLRNRDMLKYKRGESSEIFFDFLILSEHPIYFVAAYGCVPIAVCAFSCGIKHPHGKSAPRSVRRHYRDIISSASRADICSASDAR